MKERLQWTTQKYKGSCETVMSNYVSIKWTTWKRWTESQISPSISSNKGDETTCFHSLDIGTQRDNYLPLKEQLTKNYTQATFVIQVELVKA